MGQLLQFHVRKAAEQVETFEKRYFLDNASLLGPPHHIDEVLLAQRRQDAAFRGRSHRRHALDYVHENEFAESCASLQLYELLINRDDGASVRASEGRVGLPALHVLLKLLVPALSEWPRRHRDDSFGFPDAKQRVHLLLAHPHLRPMDTLVVFNDCLEVLLSSLLDVVFCHRQRVHDDGL